MSQSVNVKMGTGGDDYRVIEREHGWIIVGRMTASSAGKLLMGFDSGVVSFGVASALQARSIDDVLMVVARDAEHNRAWCEELDIEAAKLADGDAALEWLYGTDVGMSALTIHGVMTGRADSVKMHLPSDADDLGRCIRLLDRIPEWQSRIGEVGEVFPPWRRLVDDWERLVKMYAAEEWDAINARLSELTS